MGYLWGAVSNGDGWAISIWSPSADKCAVKLGDKTYPMVPRDEGWWTIDVRAELGSEYRVLVDDHCFPDPASRSQTGNVHSPSRLLNSDSYDWRADWTGRPWHEAIIYELHVGTFTPEGTFSSATRRLKQLADLGFTAIEIMPIGQWSGDRGWGYDGVLPFAPHPAYGTSDELKALVDAAHALGLMVILDFVMNHFGADGSYIHAIAPEFFDESRHTPWGASIDFSQPAVRSFWTEAASMWLRDYRFDGIRFDAVHEITGPGADEFLSGLGSELRQLHLPHRIHLIVEDERNAPQLREGPYDAAWNDDFHHAVHVALTGESQAYYEGFAVDPIADLALSLERGQVEEGQKREGRSTSRGRPSGHLPVTAFINATQNHDQIGNRMGGERLLTLADPEAAKVAYAMLLLSPYIPMVFMGEERGETAPFLYFADYQGELADKVRQGRRDEFPEFSADASMLVDPLSENTFLASKLTWWGDETAHTWLALTGRCIAFRRQYILPALGRDPRPTAEVRRIGKSSLAAVWHFAGGSLAMSINFGECGDFESDAHGADVRVNDIGRDKFALHVQWQSADVADQTATTDRLEVVL